MRSLRSHGILQNVKRNNFNKFYYEQHYLGFNYRMTDFQAAIGYGQISFYKKNLAKRVAIAKRYIKNLSKSKQISYTPFSKNNSYFIFQIFCKNGAAKRRATDT